MVRLKGERRSEHVIRREYFNSTMVRLKDLGGHNTNVNIKFQFHYGTIKRDGKHDKKTAVILFQFHYGTIKSG